MSPQHMNPNARRYFQLTLAQEDDPHPHLEIDGHVLNTGSPLILTIQAAEIAGHIELDEQGWFLDTNEVAIQLHAGLWVRLPHERGRVS